MLRPTVSRPVSFCGLRPDLYYCLTVAGLLIWGSLTRGRACQLWLQLALASAVIFGSESRGTRNHILLSQILDFPFRLLLRLAGSRWRYSTPPPLCFRVHLYAFATDRVENTASNSSSIVACLRNCCLAVAVFLVSYSVRPHVTIH
jgi:hypothetical protein